MNIKIGLVGPPNVGKSCFFNVLTNGNAKSENYPFCTKDPNIGNFIIEDRRIKQLSEVENPKNIVFPEIEIYDIAGLVKGASTGEGLGNQFLANIREVDLIIHVVRFFKNKNIISVENKIDPANDINLIKIELMLKDLESVNKKITKVNKSAKTGDKKAADELEILSILEENLTKCIPLNTILPEKKLEQNIKYINDLQLLTTKPEIYVGNIDDDITDEEKREFITKTKINYDDIIFIPVKLLSEIKELNEYEKSEFTDEIKNYEDLIEDLAKKIYKKLNIITFFTSGSDEVRGWNIHEGTYAPEAAGNIHTDFQKHFIKADICNFNEYYNAKKNNQTPTFKTYGKDYQINDGDIAIFKVGI